MKTVKELQQEHHAQEQLYKDSEQQVVKTFIDQLSHFRIWRVNNFLEDEIKYSVDWDVKDKHIVLIDKSELQQFIFYYLVQDMEGYDCPDFYDLKRFNFIDKKPYYLGGIQLEDYNTVVNDPMKAYSSWIYDNCEKNVHKIVDILMHTVELIEEQLLALDDDKNPFFKVLDKSDYDYKYFKSLAEPIFLKIIIDK